MKTSPKSHDNYMTEKEKRFVASIHKRNIIKNERVYNYRKIFNGTLLDSNDFKDETESKSKFRSENETDNEKVDLDCDNPEKLKNNISADLTAKIKAIFREHEARIKMNAKKSLKPPRIKIDADYSEKNDLFYKLQIEELADRCLKLKYAPKRVQHAENTLYNDGSKMSMDDSGGRYDSDAGDFKIDNFCNLVKIKKFYPVLRELLVLRKKDVILSILNNSNTVLPKAEIIGIFEDFYDYFPFVYVVENGAGVGNNDNEDANPNRAEDYELKCNKDIINNKAIQSGKTDVAIEEKNNAYVPPKDQEFKLKLSTNSPFMNNFLENGTGLTLAVILLLKNPDLATFFYQKLIDRPIQFLDNSDEFIWKFLTILVANLDEDRRKEVILMIRDRIYECMSEKRDLDGVSMFLEAIGIDENSEQ